MTTLIKFIKNVYAFEFDLEKEASSMIMRFGWAKDPIQTCCKYKDDPRGTLKIVFRTKDKTCYYYYKVPLSVTEGFICSDSYGKYLNEHIKGQYKFLKVTPTEGKE